MAKNSQQPYNPAHPEAADPDPGVTPGLGDGGEVPQGDTPPETAQTSGLSKPEGPQHRRFPPSGIATLLFTMAFVVVFGAVVVGLLVILW